MSRGENPQHAQRNQFAAHAACRQRGEEAMDVAYKGKRYGCQSSAKADKYRHPSAQKGDHLPVSLAQKNILSSSLWHRRTELGETKRSTKRYDSSNDPKAKHDPWVAHFARDKTCGCVDSASHHVGDNNRGCGSHTEGPAKLARGSCSFGQVARLCTGKFSFHAVFTLFVLAP